MPLTPIDVQQKTFATALRGYDLDEVDDFLDAVVVALKDYDQRLSDAQERISTLQAELNDKGDAEGAIARALVSAQRSADAIVADAKDEAQRIVSEADSEANELAEAREAERRRLQSEIDDLKGKTESVRRSVAELTAAIPLTLDEIDDVLDSNSEQTIDTADASEEHESASESEDADAPAFETGIESDGDTDEGEDAFGDDAGREAGDEAASELPPIDELSKRIESAFDGIVAEADHVNEGARPWEDS
jgi:cell division initiation protein